jgi:hypothetical protein
MNEFAAIFAISVEAGVYLRFAASLGIFVLLWFLAAMFRREAVKRDLHQRGCKPIRVWWRVFAWWSPWYEGMPFRVIYSDQNGFIHKAYCWVGHWLLDSPFSPRRVRWIKDKIIGELPLPEVWADSEILRPKLKDGNSTVETDNLLENPNKSPE